MEAYKLLKRSILLIKGLLLIILLSHCIHTASASTIIDDDDDNYIFSDDLLKAFDSNLETLSTFSSKKKIPQGIYLMDLFVNDRFMGQHKIELREINHKSVACVRDDLIANLDLLDKYIKKNLAPEDCQQVEDIISGARSRFDSENFHYNVMVPQAYLIKRPKDYVSPTLWDKGETMGFINYQLHNYYFSKQKYQANLRLHSGINVDLWRIRQIGNYYYYQNKPPYWQNDKLTVSRILPSINSELTFWESNSSGLFFPSVYYRGIKLSYDARMLPGSLQGYAPVVRGIAMTNARVVITQTDKIVFDDIIPAGPFEINDIYANAINGDLLVKIIETDGTEQSFIVPYSSLPYFLREDQFRYSAIVGEFKPYSSGNKFTELTLQYGFTSFLTLNSGIQLTNDFSSFYFGPVINSRLGAIGISGTFNRTSLLTDNNHYWIGKVTYNKYYPDYGSSLSFNLEHYFANNSYTMTEIARLKQKQSHVAIKNNTHRTRFDISLRKSFDDYGTISFSNVSDWYRNSNKIRKRIELTYSHFIHNIDYAITASHQTLHTHSERAILLSFSIPFGHNSSSSFRQSMVQNSEKGFGLQTTLNSILDEEKTLNYSLNANTQPKIDETGIGATFQKSFSQAQLGGSLAYANKGYSSASLNLQGSIVIHKDGMTPGPMVNDVFALVHAPHAKDIKIKNSQGIRLNEHGFAVVPSLTPYRSNNILLDVDEADNELDIVNGKIAVIPYSGAAIRLEFETQSGYPLLLTLSHPELKQIPMGSNVYNSDNDWLSVVGQDNQFYLRAEKTQGSLVIKWGEHLSQQCKASYHIADKTAAKILYQLTIPCTPIE